MNTSKIKTTALVFLIAGVVLQTGKLWFEGSSGHNFFNSVRQAVSSTPGEKHSLAPYSFVVNFGNSGFARVVGSADYGGAIFSSIQSVANSHLADIIQNGVFKEESDINWRTLLDRHSVLYKYPVYLSGEELADSFGAPAGDFSTRALNVNIIVITPARTSYESMMLYAVDEQGAVMHSFEGKKGVSDALLKEIDSLFSEREKSEHTLNYISSVQNRLDFFNKNVFLPEWQQQQYSYQNAYVFNPIEDTTGLEKAAQLFFDNPVGLLTAVDPAGVPFVSDSETVVKYYEDVNVLEYTGYKAASSKQTTIDQAYDKALDFMKKDLTLENDVVFVDARQTNGGFTLFFEYSFGGLRAFSAPFGHAIEITVSGGEVSKYRRIVKAIVLSEIESGVSESFISLLDRVLLEESGMRIDAVELGYDISEYGICDLGWFVNYGGNWQIK